MRCAFYWGQTGLSMTENNPYGGLLAESIGKLGVELVAAYRDELTEAWLEENRGKIDLEACMGFLRDHVDFPSSICHHPGDNPDPKERGLTLDSWISVPSKKEFWIVHGSPCENEFVKFTL